MPILTFNHIAILIVVLVAAVVDLRTKKIFNWITFPAAIVGIVSNAITGGLEGAMWAVAGWVLGALIMIFPHPKKKLGFGDAKLMAAIGAFLLPKGMLVVFLYFCVCFGAVAFVRLALVIPWKQVFRLLSIFSMTGGGHTGGFDAKPMLETMKTPIALGPSIFVGTLFGILFYSQTMLFLGFTP